MHEKIGQCEHPINGYGNRRSFNRLDSCAAWSDYFRLSGWCPRACYGIRCGAAASAASSPPAACTHRAQRRRALSAIADTHAVYTHTRTHTHTQLCAHGHGDVYGTRGKHGTHRLGHTKFASTSAYTGYNIERLRGSEAHIHEQSASD